MENTITDKIKAMFQFIEFLHSNIENFKQFDEVINELYLLDKERNNLSPRKNFIDKLKYDKVQTEIEAKFKVIQENIIFPIKRKAIELNINNFQDEVKHNWNGIESDIHNLKENFNNEDIPEILQHKGKYLEFRTRTNCTYFQDFFFGDLDEVLKNLFDFFKESSQNEFEEFETKTIHVNTIHEAVEQMQKGNTKINIPIDYLKPSKEEQNNSEQLPPQNIEFLKSMKADKIKHFLNWIKLFNEKYSDRTWSLKDIPENANIITTIDLQFNYLEKIIQDTINASNDKQAEINNFLTICDLLISKAKPKCIDPLEKENKEINEYWLSKSEALKIFVATFERHIPKTSAAEPLKKDDDKDETIEQKVRRLLIPLTEISKKKGTIILNKDNFGKLVNAYINWIVKQEYPERADRFCIYGSNPEFYGTLKDLHDKFPLKVAGIGQALTYILSQNNQHGERGKAITPGTIEKNIKNSGQY